MIDEDAVTGLTSNPSIFQKAIARRRRLRRADRGSCSSETDDPREIFFELAVDDVRDACDVLRPVWDATDGQRRLRLARGRPRPRRRHRGDARPGGRAARPGRPRRTSTSRSRPRSRACPRSRTASPRGVSINVTLIFSLERYAAVVAAYIRGLERLAGRRRRPLEGRRSVASFFVSRHRHRDRRAAREARATRELQGKLGDREREARLQALPGGVRRPALGARSPRRARACSGRSGPRPRRRTRPTATCSTSRS